MKLISYGLPLLAALALGFGIATTMELAPEMEVTSPVYEPPGTSAAERIYGLGVVEPPGGVISITSPLSGTVSEINAVPGRRVAKGDVLFRLDAAEIAADVEVGRRSLEVRRAELARMKAGSHPDDIRAAEQRLASLKTNVERAQDAFDRVSRLAGKGALAEDEHRQRRFALNIAKAEHAQAAAELARLKAGPRKTDLDVLERQIAQEEAQLERSLIHLGRSVVRAPVDALVLRVNLRKGEFISTEFASESSVVLAEDGPLHVRVQINEEDAARLRPAFPAEALLRGRSRVRLPLRFLRIEPYVIPKRVFSGKTTERVDTRVITVLYEVEKNSDGVFSGQQADVFIAVVVPPEGAEGAESVRVTGDRPPE